MTTDLSMRKMVAETMISGPSLNPDLNADVGPNQSGLTASDDLFFQVRKRVFPSPKLT